LHIVKLLQAGVGGFVLVQDCCSLFFLNPSEYSHNILNCIEYENSLVSVNGDIKSPGLTLCGNVANAAGFAG
jgi:hypothetical protein